MLWVGALDQADVQVQLRRLGELAQEPRRDVGGHAANALAREVHVRDELRPLGTLERSRGERLVGGHECPAGCGGSGRAQPLEEGAPERLARSTCRGVSAARRDLERQLEPGRPHELGDEVIQHRQAGRHVRGSRLGQRQTDACLRLAHRG